jgi:hypothetical protein
MRLILAAAFLAAVGCTTSSTTPSNDRQGTTDLKPSDDSALRAKLLGVAANYNQYERADGRKRMAPVLCAAPSPPMADRRLSRSEDESTHGKKLYTLYAAKIDSITRSYTGEALFAGKPEPLTDQVIVKESWLAVPADKEDRSFDAVVAQDGNRYKAGARGPLFVMFQTDPKDLNSDEGWVYGTLTPDGKTITGIGRLENCMSCHQKAPHGRLFGLPKD